MPEITAALERVARLAIPTAGNLISTTTATIKHSILCLFAFFIAPQKGPKTVPEITAALEELRSNPDLRLPVVHCFGFGWSHDEKLLMSIADTCDGAWICKCL